MMIASTSTKNVNYMIILWYIKNYITCNYISVILLREKIFKTYSWYYNVTALRVY